MSLKNHLKTFESEIYCYRGNGKIVAKSLPINKRFTMKTARFFWGLLACCREQRRMWWRARPSVSKSDQLFPVTCFWGDASWRRGPASSLCPSCRNEGTSPRWWTLINLIIDRLCSPRPRLPCSEAPVVNENITAWLAGSQPDRRPTLDVPSASSGLPPHPSALTLPTRHHFSQFQPLDSSQSPSLVGKCVPTSSHCPGRGRGLCTSNNPSVEGSRKAS